nr:YCF48-related protein [uncultured Albidiferax sp.]
MTRSSVIKNLVAMRSRALLASLLLAGVAITFGAVSAVQRLGLPDLLDTPTQPSSFALKGIVSGVARHGDRLIAVGPRGLILVSVDAAATWKQVATPTSTDLVSVKFTDASNAWAVGHDAVALRTTDGGATWQKVLDGRSVLTLLRATYASRAKAGDEMAVAMSTEVERSVAQSATPEALPSPFLDVWFANANEGYLVGAFGLILRTTDGGKQWEPWIERLDNERRFHLYAVTGDETQRYIAGEQGLLLRLDTTANRFVKVETPYTGTYFGLDVQGQRLVAFGLRGNAYAQTEPGAAWNKIETGVDDNLVAAVAMPDKQLMLVSQAGQVLAVSADLRTSTAVKTSISGEVLGAVSNGARGILLAQMGGVKSVNIEVNTPPAQIVPADATMKDIAK